MLQQTVQFEGESREEAIREVVQRLRAQTRRQGDDPVRVDLLEDDLREGIKTVELVREYFDDVLTLLANPDTRARDVIDIADDPQVLDHLDYLVVVANNLRRRLMQIATRGGH
ncbi:MAG TPA: hypothetical protein VGK67_11620 [Myxococcales bacterium]|jgi:hypothetical protein